MENGKFSEKSFWKTLKKYAAKIGSTVIEHALCLFYVTQEPSTPAWAKAAGYSALAYLISPFDLIPDFLPGGLVDDAAGLALAYASLLPFMTDEIKERAKTTMRSLFGAA